MSEYSWTVIQFLDDGTVEAVPSNWITGDILCYWPATAQPKMMSAIRKCEPLNTSWPAHRINIFRKATFDDYMKARIKCKKAEVTSDLTTETDSDKESKKRKKVIKTFSSSEENSEDESVLPQPPPVPKTAVLLDPKNISTNTEIPEMAISKQCMSCVQKEKHFNKLIEQGHMLRGLISDTLSEVKMIRREMKHMPVENSSFNFFNTSDIKFPIENDDDFEKLEVHFESEEFFNNATLEISKLGGSNIYDFVRRALQLIISNDEVIKFSWLGQKGKRKFRDTNLAKFLLESAERTTIPHNRKDTAIQTWVRRASDRKKLQRNCTIAKKF